MAARKTRRTVAFLEKTLGDLKKIREHTGATTDNAAIAEAIRFKAKFTDAKDTDIAEALQFKAEFADADHSAIKSALSLVDLLKKELSPTKSLIVEDSDNPNIKTKILIIT